MNTKIKNILFVCTGNTCRSPMGAAWLDHYLKSIDKNGEFLVDSCGIYAAEGMKASKGAVDRMKRDGIDLSGHFSKSLTKQMVDAAELIFCMSHTHQRYILQMAPGSDQKIIILHVDDPIGFGDQVYDQCLNDVVAGIRANMGRILEG